MSDCMSTTQVRKTNRKTRSLFVSEPFTNSTHTKKGRTEETTRQVTRTEGERERELLTCFSIIVRVETSSKLSLSSKAPMNNGGATWPGGVRHPSCPGEEERCHFAFHHQVGEGGALARVHNS